MTLTKLELRPRHLQILAGVVLLLVIAAVVGVVRTNDAIDQARAAEWRAMQAEGRAINLENKVNELVRVINELRAR